MIEATIVERTSDRQIASWLEQHLGPAFDRSGNPVRVALPGGSTPFPILEQLVTRDLDWPRLLVVPTDDRDVPEDHRASNTGKLRALFEPLGAQVVSLGRLEDEARSAWAPFKLVWLGMGADGHIASLFPNADPREDDPHRLRRITPDPLPPEAPFDRLTLTIPALLDSDQLVFVIRGADKKPVFEAALRGANDLPVARLLKANAKSGNSRPVTCFT